MDIATTHGAGIEETFPPFVWCPWCGKKLIEETKKRTVFPELSIKLYDSAKKIVILYDHQGSLAMPGLSLMRAMDELRDSVDNFGAGGKGKKGKNE